MLTALLLQFIDTMILGISHILPPLGLDVASNSYIRGICAYIGALDQLLPITIAVVPILTIQLSIFLYFAAFKSIKFVINVLRGSGAQ